MVTPGARGPGRSALVSPRALLPAALGLLGIAVLSSALTTPPYELVLGCLFAGACLLAVLGYRQGPDVNPFVGPLSFKLAILSVTVLLQPSLVGRDPHFELAVTERLIEQGTWEPGLGFASQKAEGYAHYPGLSFVAGSLSVLSGVDPAGLARVLPPTLTVLALVLVITIARQVTDDDRLAMAVGFAWAAFSLTNVFHAEYVHESLGFVFFLAGAVLAFRYVSSEAKAPLAVFTIVATALAFTHHLSTAFLLAFLALVLLSDLVLTGVGLGSGVRRVAAPLGLFGAIAVAYSLQFGHPSVFGQFESLVDTVSGPFTEPTTPAPDGNATGPSNGTNATDAGNATNASGTAPDDPNVRRAVFYERRGRDVALFNARAAFTFVLTALALVNVAWRALHGTLDTRRTSLLAWSALVLGVMLSMYLANVTIGLDTPRLLPWGYVFLLVLAADVPDGGELLAAIRRRLASIHQRLGDVLADAGRPLFAGVLALLVLFGGFQLLTIPTHLVSEEREPAYYRSQVRQYYHDDEQAMATWIDEDIDDGTTIFGDMSSYELVGPTDHGELTVTGSYVYSGDRQPLDPTYVVWRDEMDRLYLGLDKHLDTIFFPVPEEQQRTFEASPSYAQLYATQRTGVYGYEQ